MPETTVVIPPSQPYYLDPPPPINPDGSTTPPVPPVPPMLPPSDSYRYDGGPTNPVPVPRGPKPTTPPVPNTIRTNLTLKVTYPAYGEASDLASRDTLVIKSRQK
jgi:hypothetical protein